VRRFVAEGGKIIQQGYASNEPYRWEHDVPAWKKPVKFLLVHASGYQIYPQGLAVRASQLAPSTACLKLLVPITQRAQVDYMSSRLIARQFGPKEKEVVARSYAEFLNYYQSHEADASKLLTIGESKADATLPVDKFAALPWTGEVGGFFGRVERHEHGSR
jgi:hypothetical protein